MPSRRRSVDLAAAALVLLGAAACDGNAASSTTTATQGAAPGGPQIWFREEARSRGLVFDHHSGAKGEYLLPESVCAGCALFDMDGDGDLDAYVVESDGAGMPRARRRGNRLFENRGDGTFQDISERSGADDHGFGMGVAAGDCDGDGDTDLYVTNLDGSALLRNDGAGRFTDVTVAAGVRGDGWPSSAAFFDADADGDLDLWVCRYVRWSADNERRCDGARGGLDYCAPAAYEAPSTSILYRNDGNGRFTDISEAAGIRAASGNGLGVAIGDFDGDLRPDVFVANDGTENHLWIQQADGTFRNAALSWGCAMDRDGIAKAGMGVLAADFDDDGDLDVVVCNLVDQGDSFYRNEGRHFADRTTHAGLAAASKPYTRFGCGTFDFDLDGLLDLYVANGRVTRHPRPESSDPYAEPNQVLRGTGAGRFEALVPIDATETPIVATSRGAAFGDIDGDGDIDVLVTNRDGPAHLFVNVAPRRGRWVTVRAVERTGGDAIGASVAATIGARRVVRDVQASRGYCASSDPRVHLGLGGETTLADVRVRWSDGTVEAFGDLAAERVHELRRGRGSPSAWAAR